MECLGSLSSPPSGSWRESVELLGLVAYAGPAGAGRLGISGWWGAVVSAVIWVAFVRWLVRHEQASGTASADAPGPVGIEPREDHP
jgi:hypothetical protein